ncbi:hypothetical protein FB451DRAFT_1172759 [Mycena latifolia]|nr:hypothetical protein FB451DRAFT_1172759 [Mycena latifolia]
MSTWVRARGKEHVGIAIVSGDGPHPEIGGRMEEERRNEEDSIYRWRSRQRWTCQGDCGQSTKLSDSHAAETLINLAGAGAWAVHAAGRGYEKKPEKRPGRDTAMDVAALPAHVPGAHHEGEWEIHWEIRGLAVGADGASRPKAGNGTRADTAYVRRCMAEKNQVGLLRRPADPVVTTIAASSGIWASATGPGPPRSVRTRDRSEVKAVAARKSKGRSSRHRRLVELLQVSSGALINAPVTDCQISQLS